MSTPSTVTPRSYHHGDLRSAIIERSAEIIDSSGIEALTLRGIARDLGVSHGAPNRHFRNKAELLVALAAEGWKRIADVTMSAAEECGSEEPSRQLNAMGRAFLHWALANRALFRAVCHPDVTRHSDVALLNAMDSFKNSVREVVARTQATGRSPGAHINVLTLYTNAVPMGAAMMLLDPLMATDLDELDRDLLIEQVINLVVPIE